VAVAAVAAAACGSSSTTPTPTPPPPPPVLTLTCPSDQTQQSTTSQPIPMQYPASTSTGGTPPTQIVCAPASGDVFNIGTTKVTCNATDSKAVTASCSFNVTLTVPPKVSQTAFVAFGDSMTAGEVVSESRVSIIEGGVQSWVRPLQVDISKAYPTLLQNELRARYTGQAGAISVANAGNPGELAVQGQVRLPSVIDGGRYKVLLLMEGVNDFPNYQSALGAMRTMVEYGKRRGLLVYLATLPPENPNTNACGKRGGNWAYVDPYNTGLRDLANAEGISLVDVYAAFGGDTTTLIDCDGLHPTPAGYQVIADTFFKSIQATLEVPSSTATPTVLRSAVRTAPARRSR